MLKFRDKYINFHDKCIHLYETKSYIKTDQINSLLYLNKTKGKTPLKKV